MVACTNVQFVWSWQWFRPGMNALNLNTLYLIWASSGTSFSLIAVVMVQNWVPTCWCNLPIKSVGIRDLFVQANWIHYEQTLPFQVSLLPVIIIHYQNSSKVPENVATCHMSGIYSSMFFLGSFLGPILGGVLLSYTSYSWTFIIAGTLFVINLIVVIGIYFRDRTFLSPVVQCEITQPYFD